MEPVATTAEKVLAALMAADAEGRRREALPDSLGQARLLALVWLKPLAIISQDGERPNVSRSCDRTRLGLRMLKPFWKPGHAAPAEEHRRTTDAGSFANTTQVKQV